MYCGYITTLSGVRKHSNADRLQCVEVFGSNVIVDLTYKDGDKVVYFPTDGQLDYDFADKMNLIRKKDENGNNVGGYLDPDKRNITAIKLRGEKSDGLVLPISCLAEYTDITKLKDGDQVSEFNGVVICKKYVPANKHKKHGSKSATKNAKREKVNVSYPMFDEHIDTSQLAFNRHVFKEGDTIYLTQKLHGTSFRVSNTVKVVKKQRNIIMRKLFHAKAKEELSWDIVSGSRRVTLTESGGGFNGHNSFRKKYHDLFAEKLPKGMTVFGEIVGYMPEGAPIMPRCNNDKVKDKEFSKKYGKETVFSYGCKPGENDCYIYRITMANQDGVTIELPTEETKLWCEKLGVKYVPLLEKFIYTTWEDLNERCSKYLDVPEPLANGSHVTEGVVVRIDNRSKFTAYKTKSFAFKVLEGIIKDTADAPDIEEAEDVME